MMLPHGVTTTDYNYNYDCDGTVTRLCLHIAEEKQGLKRDLVYNKQ